MHELKIPNPKELKFKTDRLSLEPVTSEDLEMIWQLYNDEDLHTYTPFELKPIEGVERFKRWTKQESPDGSEVWINWVVRRLDNDQVVGHVQAGIKKNFDAYVGYLMAREHHQKGYATEAMTRAMEYLKSLRLRELKAYVDTRNAASIALLTKLGFEKKEVIEDADYFKGSPSHEYVFSITLNELTTA